MTPNRTRPTTFEGVNDRAEATTETEPLPAPTRPLVIVDRFPLPAVTGGRQRMWNYLLAIDAIGPADLVVLEHRREAEHRLLATALPTWTVQQMEPQKKRSSVVTKVSAAVRRELPSSLAALDLDAVVGNLQSAIGSRSLIVAIQPLSAMIARAVAPRSTRTVVDLWDVEDDVLKRIGATRERSKQSLLRGTWNRYRDEADLVAWKRFYADLTSWADGITVCSAVDRDRLPPSGNTWVVPNGADVPLICQQRDCTSPPVILYLGQLTYFPNVDAAELLARDVMPLVRRTHPTAELRLVGRADNRVVRLNDPPRVTVTGLVADIEPELKLAWMLVVPLRSGGGTRLKILEAFAAGMPVISTSVGAEGLDVTDGHELLIADDAASLGAAVCRLIADGHERQRLAANAFRLVQQRYDWTSIRRELTNRLRRLSSSV